MPSPDLASHCRLLLYDRPKHKRLIRYGVLYPLYVLSEVAIVSTDLAELLGSAIGLCLIFPSIPLWAAVLITASDVLIFLILGDPSRGQGRPVKIFEYTVIALVSATTEQSPVDIDERLHCRLLLSLSVSSCSSQEWTQIGDRRFWGSSPIVVYSRHSLMPCTQVSVLLSFSSFSF